MIQFRIVSYRSMIGFCVVLFVGNCLCSASAQSWPLVDERVPAGSKTFDTKAVIEEYSDDQANELVIESVEWLNVAARQWRDEVSCKGTFVTNTGRIYVDTLLPSRASIINFDGWTLEYRGRFAKLEDYFYYRSTLTPETAKNVPKDKPGNDEELLASKNVAFRHNREHRRLTASHNLERPVKFPTTWGPDPARADC